MIRRKLRAILGPIASLALIVLGMAFFMTFVSVKMKSYGATNEQVGFVHAAYSAGLFIGALVVERFVKRIGHGRFFAICASVAGVTVLVMGLFDRFWVWFAMRFVAGIAMAGQYVTIESWLMSAGGRFERGKLLAIYTSVFYASQAVSQFWMDVVVIHSAEAYFITAIFCSFAVLPILFHVRGSPDLPEVAPFTVWQILSKSPFGFMGCFVSGMIIACLNSMSPIFAMDYNIPVSWQMFSTIAGGIALQWPLGKLSDIVNRRLMLLVMSLAFVIPCLLIWNFPEKKLLVLASSFLIGGLSFTLYPLSTTEVCDHFDNKHLTGILTILLIAFGLGAIVGPILGPWAPFPHGILGIYLFYLSTALFLFVFGLVTLGVGRRVRPKDKTEFVNLPNVTPVAFELDPRVEESKKEHRK